MFISGSAMAAAEEARARVMAEMATENLILMAERCFEPVGDGATVSVKNWKW